MFRPFCFLSIFWGTGIVFVDLAFSDPCHALKRYLHVVAAPQIYRPESFVSQRFPLRTVSQKMVNMYKSDLLGFAQRMKKMRAKKQIRMVVYPFSGYDVLPFFLFPETHSFVFIDNGAPFLPEGGCVGPVHYRTESDKVIAFPVANPCGYRCHGEVHFDFGKGTTVKEMIYIQGTLERVPLQVPGALLSEPVIIFVGSGLAQYLPITTLSQMDAMVVRGAMAHLMLEWDWLSLVPRANQTAFPFLYFLSRNAGVLVEGRDPTPSLWEVFPPDIDVNRPNYVKAVMQDESIKFSYGDGIRAVFLR